MAKTQKTVIQIQNLETRFGEALIHKKISLEVYRGEIFAIVGGSGSGKSTLLREIIMLTSPSAGSIRVFGEELRELDEARAARLQARFGVMFQQGALFSSFTVLENVALPLKEHTQLSSRFITELALHKIKLVGLPLEAACRYPRELSGGMIKRVAVARALVLDPELLFLDEPSAGLDPVSAAALDELILELRASLDLTVVLVTHDLDSLWRIADRAAFLGEKTLLGLDTVAALARSEHRLLQAYFKGPRGRTAQESAWTQK
ncbi:ABC transporter related protein [Nitrosococcus halophilus Nc 4]|uniref:ABC transporter related protein n=1 Tax=Nitrosococcus halophilus (strain Nc4) TaxID=472759 RepID=D5BVM6_NITHN|nr:ATP-binding cassette domain-containing protein [Nitrosococcus halophilus]ADE13654.1 ABC transporter related protein [Nitrosococcus halophilus Nc 4]